MKIDKRTLLLLAMTALPGREAAAQSIVRDVNLAVLNLGPVRAIPVDDDGNPATEAWLVVTDPPGGPSTVRLFVVRPNGSLCVESPFNPTAGLPNADAELVRFGGRDMMQVTTELSTQGQPMRLLSIDRVRCR